MVAPHDTGDLVRSLVRVPGSGSDRSAGSQCLDLSRASSMAASVPVPQSLPPSLASPSVAQPQRLRDEKLGGEVGAATGVLRPNGTASNSSESNKRSFPKEITVVSGNGNGEAPNTPKRARVVYMTPHQVLSQANRIVPLQSPIGPVLFLPLQPQTSNSPPLSLSEASLSQLIQERNNLRQENQALQQRLALFQQLFKDRRRLGSVVKRLGVKLP